MKAWLKMGALACVFSTALGGMARSEDVSRESTTELCWMEAHKEYPKDSGNDVNNSALARAAYFQYLSCMESHGLKP